jgi:prepilin-type N-terminal cleavage/methylation domain-containing protein
MSRRRGVTLVELLIVIAIIGVLLGMVLAAIQAARESAMRTSSQNNLRQIAVAAHNYAGQRDSRLPRLVERNGPMESTFFGNLLPHLEADRSAERVRIFISPADPTLDSPARTVASPTLGPPRRESQISYALNAEVVVGPAPASLNRNFGDGLANTLLFAEHYSVCNGFPIQWDWTDYLMSGGNPPLFATIIRVVTSGNPPFSAASYPGLTFQVRPCPRPQQDCGSRKLCNLPLPQTPFRGGLYVALADASVRSLAPGMSEHTYWAAVTPAAGDSLGSDW